MRRQTSRIRGGIISVDSVINNDFVKPNFIEPVYKDKNEMLFTLVSQGCHHEIHGRLIKTSLYKDHNLTCREGFNMGEDWYMLPRLVWYADKLAWVRKKLYHYVMNDNSYMLSKKTLEQRITSKYQDYVNQAGAWEFFKDKDQQLYLASQRFTINTCKILMQMVLSANDKSFYYRIRKHLLKNYRFEVLKHGLGRKVTMFLHLPFSYHILRRIL